MIVFGHFLVVADEVVDFLVGHVHVSQQEIGSEFLETFCVFEIGELFEPAVDGGL